MEASDFVGLLVLQVVFRFLKVIVLFSPTITPKAEASSLERSNTPLLHLR